MKRLLAYIARNEDADLPRVYAAQGYAGALLRTVDMARLETELGSARAEVERLTRADQELRWELDRERARPKSADLAELEAVRAENRRLTERAIALSPGRD